MKRLNSFSLLYFKIYRDKNHYFAIDLLAEMCLGAMPTGERTRLSSPLDGASLTNRLPTENFGFGLIQGWSIYVIITKFIVRIFFLEKLKKLKKMKTGSETLRDRIGTRVELNQRIQTGILHIILSEVWEYSFFVISLTSNFPHSRKSRKIPPSLTWFWANQEQSGLCEVVSYRVFLTKK